MAGDRKSQQALRSLPAQAEWQSAPLGSEALGAEGQADFADVAAI
jgi:hypothetical protein